MHLNPGGATQGVSDEAAHPVEIEDIAMPAKVHWFYSKERVSIEAPTAVALCAAAQDTYGLLHSLADYCRAFVEKAETGRDPEAGTVTASWYLPAPAVAGMKVRCKAHSGTRGAT